MPLSRRVLLLSATSVITPLFGGCVAVSDTPKTWMELSLPGTSLILDSEIEVEELRFLGEPDGGWVAATIGTKGGPLTAPLFPWRLEGNLLVIGHDQPFERLELLRLEEKRVVVRRSSGSVVVFHSIKT
jgi:hypothetical protein